MKKANTQNFTKALGELLRQRRSDTGMSQMALAEKLGVSYQQVQKYEAGRSSIRVTRLMQYAWALGMPSEKLFMQALELEDKMLDEAILRIARGAR